ncbi:MAG: hypothetical protein Q8K24_05945 [Hydrogenophaga sp.]|nr:hypothetical protein [Hydrogenophaga sp.]
MPRQYTASATVLGLVAQPPATLVAQLVPFFRGPQGEPGPVGPSGGDLHHTHTQAVAADEWVIEHGLGKCPAVTVVDSAGDQVEGDVEYIDLDNLRIVFSSAFSGRAYLN